MVDAKEIKIGSRYVWSRHGRQSIVEVLDGPHRLPPEYDLDTDPPTVKGKGAEWGYRVRRLDDELRSMIARADELEPPLA